MMQNLNLTMPAHITEALRTSMSGARCNSPDASLSAAAAAVPFMSLAELRARLIAAQMSPRRAR
jgi:hypothetical protein